MTNLTTDRATKKAYFTDLDGGHIFEFQFSPNELDFKEGGQYVDMVMTGNFFTDLIWISGVPNRFNLRVFIDRTQESYVVEDYNQDPFSAIIRFPSARPRMSSYDATSMIMGLKQSSGLSTSFKKDYQGGGNSVDPSKYSSSPDFKQSQMDGASGVLKDLEALMYYVRPKGLKLSEITIQQGQVSVKDFPTGRFVPPPMIRFYYGAMWREGYLINVDYNLSVMNNILVPRRLDANLTIACTRWGYLNELGSSAIENATDSYDTPLTGSNNTNGQFA